MTAPANIQLARPFSVPQLAHRWGCSEGLIRKMIRDGRLQCFRPEGGSPDGIARFSVLSGAANVLFDGTCSLVVHGARFTLNLSPCLSAADRVLASYRAGEVGK